MREEQKIRTSVIIPVYNTAEYLEECLDSVLAQTQKEFELILVDDGSDDGSLEICQRYADQYPFVTLLQQEHLYQGTARNRGLEIARGEYVYFMDSDDDILPELFEKAYEICERDGLDYLMFDSRGFLYDPNDTELEVPEDIYDRTTLGIEDRIYTGPEYWNRFYNHHGILYVCWLHYIRREFLLEHRLFYEERTYFEDNDWILRMYLNAERIRFLPEQLHLHRWRRGSNMLGGFTAGLLEGCFRMHRVLPQIFLSCETEEKRRMVRNVIDLNINRFGRLAELSPAPGPEYTEPLDRFCLAVSETLSSEDMPREARAFSLLTAGEILKGIRDWSDRDFTDRQRERFRKGAGDYYHLGRPEERVAIFGTGKVSGRFLDAYREIAGEPACSLCFLKTGAEEGETFLGYPVEDARRAGELDLSFCLIASTKYREEMIGSLRAAAGDVPWDVVE